MTDREPEAAGRAFALFDEAIELPAEAWEAWVAERADGDEALAVEVLGLLAAHASAGLLDRPIDTRWPSATGDPVDLEALLASVDTRITQALEDRYHRFERLGHGGMAVVFGAQERKHDRPVVLKVLRPDVATRHGEERFLQEVRLASGLTHPHILAFIDSGRADGLLYYVMPHVDGETLYDRVRREGVLEPDAARPLLRDVADALAYAHEQGVVHRDLKPANVLCAGDHAYLMDFGIAKALHQVDPDDGLTRPGYSPGTPRYMAPEQLGDGSHAGAASDVYAWGQLAHEVLTGTLVPDSGSSPSAINERLARQAPSLPAVWGNLIGQALALDPQARPTARGVYDALRFQEARSTGSRTRRWAFATLAAAGLAALVLAGTRASSDAESGPASLFQDGAIAVAEFRNETGDADLDFLGRMAGDWITQGLRDLEQFSVVPWALSQEVVERARGDSAFNPIQILQAETRAATVITGRYYRVGDQISFRADITDAVAGQVLAGTNPVTSPIERPERAVEELRERLLGTVSALSGESANQDNSVASNTPTLDAYRAFDTGRKHHFVQEYEQARDAFLVAHERDTTFLPTLISAAMNAGNVGDDRTVDSIMAYLGDRRSRLSRYDDLSWQYLEALRQENRYEALRALRVLTSLAPGERSSYNLSLIANSLNRPAEALASLGGLDPDAGAAKVWAQYWTQLATSLHLLGRHIEESDAAAEMVDRHPERVVAFSLLARAQAASGQIEALDETLATSALRPPRTYWSHGGALVITGQALLAHGSATPAAPYLDAAETWLNAQIASDPDYMAHRYWLANVLYSQQRWPEASELLDDMMVRSPTSAAYRGLAAVIAARLDDAARAAALLDAGEWSGAESDRLLYSARVAAIVGDFDKALAELSSALALGKSSFGWAHSGGHHEFSLMREDPRLERLLRPIELGS